MIAEYISWGIGFVLVIFLFIRSIIQLIINIKRKDVIINQVVIILATSIILAGALFLFMIWFLSSSLP